MYFISTCIWQHLCILFLLCKISSLTPREVLLTASLALVLTYEGITTRGRVAEMGIETVDLGISEPRCLSLLS